ncbi:MAG: hypothetical protein NT098_05965 [Candidatus Parcubacteria bacterium]|nr:hypothetical protein [Candidatus Parcubacteria bacterium]
MNTLEMMGLERKPFILLETEPIKFPVPTKKEGHKEFFQALEKHRSVRYSWKFGRLITTGCEPLKHEEFAEILGRVIPTATDMIRILSSSGIVCKITEWKEYLSSYEAKALESMTGISRLCLPAPEGEIKKKEIVVGFDMRSLSEKKESMTPISFPVNVSKKEDSEFFKVLESVSRVTYNYEKGVMYLIDNTIPNHLNVKTISHEDFAKAVGQNIATSAEMLLLLSVSKISFRVTCYEDMVSEKQMAEFNNSLTKAVSFAEA